MAKRTAVSKRVGEQGGQFHSITAKRKTKPGEVFHTEPISPNVARLENPLFYNSSALSRQLFMPESGEKVNALEKEGERGVPLSQPKTSRSSIA